MNQIPLIILGGRDSRSAELPEAGRDFTRLQGYKGAHLRLGGRPLISLLIERMEACGVFSPIWIAGPKEVFEPVAPDYRVIDTDGSFGDNLRAGIEALQAETTPKLIAVATCDILPDPDELKLAVADLMSRQPLDFWMPHIPVRDSGKSLGTSEWKPRYRLQPPSSPEAIATLPGHIIVADIRPLRLPFVYHLFDLLYQTRNTTVGQRRFGILKRVLGFLLREDLGYLAKGQRPYALFDVVYHGLTMAARLKAGRGVTTELEDGMRKLFFTRQHRRLHPRRRGRIAVIDVMSLARDIDTEEEAEEFQKIAEQELKDQADQS